MEEQCALYEGEYYGERCVECGGKYMGCLGYATREELEQHLLDFKNRFKKDKPSLEEL